MVTPKRVAEIDGISEIKAKSKSGKRQDEASSSEDDLLDEMSKFVEGADLELVKDHSNLMEEDDKPKKVREQRAKPEEERKGSRYDADGGKEAERKALERKKKDHQQERREERRMGGNRVEKDESK